MSHDEIRGERQPGKKRVRGTEEMRNRERLGFSNGDRNGGPVKTTKTKVPIK